MCGRMTLKTTGESLAEAFDLDEIPDLLPRYNIAPTQLVAAIRRDDAGRRRLARLRWGLVPFWAKDLKIGNQLINARSETIAEKPAFRSAFKKRRCIVPVDGFYEWKKLPKTKQPYLIGRRDKRPFAIAGLWESWTSPEGEVVETCTLLTTESNELIRELHNRMPVILVPRDIDVWLDPARSPEDLKQLLSPAPAAEMAMVAVSQRVNSPRVDDADLWDPES